MRRLAHLGDLPGIKYQGAIRQASQVIQIMREDEHRETALAAQFSQQFQNESARQHIQSRRRFVHDQQIRITCQRHREHCVLLFAAAQLMWESFKQSWRQADSSPQRKCPLLRRDLIEM